MAEFSRIYPWAGPGGANLRRELDKVWGSVEAADSVADGALQASNDLSDLSSVSTGRTNLGLVAGGAGDIWVEKAGDTMTGNLTMDTGAGRRARLAEASLSFIKDSGAMIADLDLTPSDGTSAGRLRVNRNTSSSGVKRIEIYEGDGTATETHRIATGGVPSWLCAGNEGLAVGTASATSGYALTLGGDLDASSAAKVLFGGAEIHVGAGSPESVITAPPGSLYLNTSGGAGTSLYVKESGTGNTGWVGK